MTVRRFLSAVLFVLLAFSAVGGEALCLPGCAEADDECGEDCPRCGMCPTAPALAATAEQLSVPPVGRRSNRTPAVAGTSAGATFEILHVPLP